MTIGSVIKQLRREKGMTQEQLAEALGITSRAVSQWECGNTAPDLSQIPALCHIFSVSADTLLGIDIEKNEAEIQSCLDRAREAANNGHFEASADILREGNRRFPRAYPIMQQLANAIVCVNARRGIRDYDEVIALCRRVLEECTDNRTRCEAMDTLGTAYGYAGKEEELRKLADEMSGIEFSREDFMRYHWLGEADFPKLQDYLWYLILRLLEMLPVLCAAACDDGTQRYTPEEQKSLLRLTVDLAERIFPDGDYQFAAQFGVSACRLLTHAFLREGDTDSAWLWLEKTVDFAGHMDTYDFDAPHTALPLRGFRDGGWIMEADGNQSQSLLDWLTTDEKAAPLRDDPRCDAMVQRLCRTAKKPE